MDEENKIDLEKKSEQDLPPVPSNDEAWAEKLGLDYDPRKAQTPPPPTPPPPFPPAYPRNPQQPALQPPASQPQAPQEEKMPDSYLLWSILALVFCCMPTAIVAIIYSAQVSSKFYARDYEGARKASERAQMWIIASIVLGVITMTVYLPLCML